MKQIVLLGVLFLISFVAFSKDKKDEVEKYNETYRDQFHFSPEVNRMSSPIDVFSTDTTYHLLFQYNPHNLLEGFINWGQASSNNLLNWKQEGLVVKQPESVTDSIQQVPWAGAVCKTETGYRAWINRWNDGIYTATSSDGKTWSTEVKTTGTDSLAKSEADIFWHQPTKKWIMAAFERVSTTMYLLGSTDGIEWNDITTFNYSFGFPQLFELPVDRKTDDTRWVLSSEKGTYLIGTFDGTKFDISTSIKKFNQSEMIGSSVFFPSIDGEKIYSMTSLKAKQQADLPSNGQLTFPTEVSLHEFENGIEMIQKPAAQIEQLYDKTYSFDQTKVYPGLNNNLLKKVKGTELHLKAVIDVKTSDQFGFIIRSDKNSQGTEFMYNVKRKTLSFLRTNMDYTPVNGKLEIEILVDRSSIEIFIEGGRYVMSYPFSPSPESVKYELYTTGGEIFVDQMEVHQLKSVWTEE